MRGTNKSHPVDSKPIPFRNDIRGDLTLVTPDGRVCKGIYDPSSTRIAYTSHFATCPNANEWRKR